MRTESDVRRDVMLAVLDKTDRSIEMTIELAVRAGIEHERKRISEILRLSAPPGLERAIIELALCPSATVDQAAHFLETLPLAENYSAKLRSGIRLIKPEPIEEKLS